jgi:hypothetical protein
MDSRIMVSHAIRFFLGVAEARFFPRNDHSLDALVPSARA